MTRTPRITADLLDYLASVYPLRPPQPSQSDREIWITAGQQYLIEHLKKLYEKQTTRGEL